MEPIICIFIFVAACSVIFSSAFYLCTQRDTPVLWATHYQPINDLGLESR